MSEPSTTCRHTRQRAREEIGAAQPYTYYCADCGEVTSRSAECSPLYGIPYYYSPPGSSFWLGLERKEWPKQ